MKYYVCVHGGYDYFNHFAVIKGELLTEKERNSKARYLSDNYFQAMEINRSHTMINFGVRLVQSKYRPLYKLPSMF